MNPYLLTSGLIFLVPGLVGLARPDATLAFDDWVETRLWKRAPLPNDAACVRKTSLIETILGGLMIAFSFS